MKLDERAMHGLQDSFNLFVRKTTGLGEKVPAKFGEESFVKADGLCIGCISQWRENSNMQEFFCTTLYVLCSKCTSTFERNLSNTAATDVLILFDDPVHTTMDHLRNRRE